MMSAMIDAWGWPQWTYAGLTMFAIIMAAALHGKDVDAKHNVLLTLILRGIVIYILISGGFFAPK